MTNTQDQTAEPITREVDVTFNSDYGITYQETRGDGFNPEAVHTEFFIISGKAPERVCTVTRYRAYGDWQIRVNWSAWGAQPAATAAAAAAAIAAAAEYAAALEAES